MAYEATVASPLRRPVHIGESLVCYHGTIDVTEYHQTLEEITDITGKFFDGDPSVILSGVSESGYLCHWDPTVKAVKCFYPVTAHQHDFTIQVSGSIGTDMEVGLSSNSAGATFEGGAGITTTDKTLTSTTPVDAAAKAAGTEVANAVDVGIVYFFAVGLR